VLATAAIAAVLGVLACALIIGYVARRLRLPVRETLMWFGLIELDVSAVARANQRRRR
jgi:hypothetical protein